MKKKKVSREDDFIISGVFECCFFGGTHHWLKKEEKGD